MKKIHKTITGIVALLAITSTTAVFSTVAMANSIPTEETIVLTTAAADKASTYDNTSTDIYKPIVIWDNTQYNMVVRYDWRVGKGGNEVALSPNTLYYLRKHTPFYQAYELNMNIDSNYWQPEYYAGKSYNSSTDTYSYDYVSLEHDVNMGDYITVRYGYETRYTCVGRLSKSQLSVGSKVPTSYDEQYFIWNHNSGKGHRIKGTIEYKDQLADIEVTIPWIGYKSSSVSIDGQTFYIRTGPNKCSIKAESSNINVADLNFAFGVE